MIVRVDADGTVQLMEPGNLRQFHVAMPDTAIARAALATVARPDGRDHAWFAPDRLRSLAGPVPPGWDEQFAAMLAYAASKGWTDDGGAVRAHIVLD